MTIPVGDAISHAFRLDGDVTGALRDRAAASGLDPGEALDTAAPETLAAWVMAALAPNVSAARAANDLGALRSQNGRFGEFLAGVFAEARGQNAGSSFGLLAQSDVIVFRDEDGAAAATINVPAHADDDARRLHEHQLAFATLGAGARNLRVTAVLPGQALAALALAAAGAGTEVIDLGLVTAGEARALRRAEGHRLSRSEGIAHV